MDLEAARAELSRAAATAAPSTGMRFRAAHDVLAARGVEALGITGAGLALDEIVRIAIEAPPTEARRAFAVLLVHALGLPGLLPTRGRTADDVRLFLERALLNPLRRAGYPFGGTPHDKRQALARLHATIDEHLRPPEPSIPLWLHGLRGD